MLGFIRVWILGVVDYHGSRLVAFDRLRRGTSEEIARVLAEVIEGHGAPERATTLLILPHALLDASKDGVLIGRGPGRAPERPP